MSRVDAFAGSLWLRPGTPRPHNLRSTRPDWVRRITQDLPAVRLPATLGNLFSLCSHAHALCAAMAVDAARGVANTVSAVDRARHAQQTLREHLRRLWLDWPQRLVSGAKSAAPSAQGEAAARALATCPVFAREPGPAAGWIEAHALGMPPGDWLRRWEDDPAAWLATWAQHTELPIARLLRHTLAVAGQALAATPSLAVHADASHLHALAGELRACGHGFARQPSWQGACAETGAWTRRHEPQAARLDSVALRLGARLAEVVRLALPDAPARSGAAWLQLGALPLGECEGIAWVEMARGLLVHHVRLDGHGAQARVVDCHVVAPTEWNFHPRGAVAGAIEHLAMPLGHDAKYRLDALLAAYDPCVPCEFETPVAGEVAHA